MTRDQQQPPPQAAPFEQAALALLCVLFFGSGCAALIYEIVWLQTLALVIGSTAVSLGVLLGVFMGGMCLGSLALPRWVPRSWHPLRAYAALEAGLGICGLIVPFAVPVAGQVYAALGGTGLTGLLLRGLLCGACLLPPTLLMGATLPAVARKLRTTPTGVSWLGLFYGGNIAGAVCGCLLAGFSLLRFHDARTATFVAAAINIAVSAFAFTLAALGPQDRAPAQPDPESQMPMRRSGAVGVVIALSGFCALSGEVVWTRLLSLMLGPTVYTFSTILAVYLVGLGIGSVVGAWITRSHSNPRFALGACQLLVAGAIAWAAWMLGRSLPWWPINPSLSRAFIFNFQLDLLRCAWVLLPATVLWGASFPLALAAAAPAGGDPGRLAGRIYAANTLGAILGALACSLWLIPAVGTQQIQRLLIVVSAAAGLGICGLARADERRDAPQRNGALGGVARLCAGLALLALLAWSVPPVPWELVAYGRYLPSKDELGSPLFVGEGMNASVAVTQLTNGVRNFHVSGKIEASTDARDMRLQRMLAHLPALVHPHPESILVVGCGAGVTAGSFVGYPEVKRIVICEIEPLIPRAVAPYFRQGNQRVLEDPRTTVVYDDARHFILTSRDRFDIITSDPIHPWVKGAATLYTREYFELCRQHLNPGGLVTQWVPLYESNLPAVKSEIATFFSVFADGTIWSNDEKGDGYDVLLLGSAGSTVIDLTRLQQRLARDDYRAVRDSLHGVGYRSGAALLATFAGQARDLAPWLNDAQINLDRNLRLEYLAGLGLNFYEQRLIYADLEAHVRYPDALFAGTTFDKKVLRDLFDRRHPPDE